MGKNTYLNRGGPVSGISIVTTNHRESAEVIVVRIV